MNKRPPYNSSDLDVWGGLNPWPPANKYGLQAESLDMKYPEPGTFGEQTGFFGLIFSHQEEELAVKTKWKIIDLICSPFETLSIYLGWGNKSVVIKCYDRRPGNFSYKKMFWLKVFGQHKVKVAFSHCSLLGLWTLASSISSLSLLQASSPLLKVHNQSKFQFL